MEIGTWSTNGHETPAKLCPTSHSVWRDTVFRDCQDRTTYDIDSHGTVKTANPPFANARRTPSHGGAILNSCKQQAPRDTQNMTAWLLPTLALTSLTLGSSLWFTSSTGCLFLYPSGSRGTHPAHQRRRRAGEPSWCSSSTAASSDSAREEESWPAELNVEPLLRPNRKKQQSATCDRARVFAKRLPEGTKLRGMQKGDVDGVVSL